MRRRSIALIAALLLIPCTWSIAQDADADGIPDEIEAALGTNPNAAEDLLLIVDDERKDQTAEQATRNAPDIISVAAVHVAADRYLWRIEFAGAFRPAGTALLLYLDADNNPNTGRQDSAGVKGTDIMYICLSGDCSASIRNPAYQQQSGLDARGVLDGNLLYFCDDLALATDGDRAAARFYVLSQREGGESDVTEWADMRLPRNALTEKPPVAEKWGPDFTGLTRAQVEPDRPRAEMRERPSVPFSANGPTPEKGATVQMQAVSVEVLEEDGVARDAAILSFGFPFAQGSVFNTDCIRVTDGATEVPAQATAMSLWPDNSLCWVLIDCITDLDANQQKALSVEFGSSVSRAAIPRALQTDTLADTVRVVTGPMQVDIAAAPFRLAQGVWIDGNGDGAFTEVERIASCSGAELIDADGTLFTAGAATMRVELAGPLKTVLRFEGPYIDAAGRELLSHITRLTFVAGSTTVGVSHTLVDTYLETEFHDIAALSMPLSLTGGPATTATYACDAGDPVEFSSLRPPARTALQECALADGAARLAQLTDDAWSLRAGDNILAQGKRTCGAVDYAGADGSGITVAVTDFWQRYPKALAVSADRLDIQLLPPIPGSDTYAGLPWHLGFPFVGGKYRFKWGMSTTDRVNVTFRPAGSTADVAAAAAGVRPIVAVIPSGHHEAAVATTTSKYYQATGALGAIVAKVPGEFEEWDNLYSETFARHMARKEAEREYGYLNWGDWFGERGRNWGNNEYDLPHSLFLQFARTGNRDYFRLALAGARHQADVDCVHAYPDPYVVGANHPHSVCHTGEGSEMLRQPKWTRRYDKSTSAENGHTWTEGMVDAWYLSGDPRPMEAAIGIAEHITWQMAPTFDQLGTHERSAGWSLQAVLGVYRATGDPAYLDAANRIAEVPLREQKFDQGGAWPHVLPGDHAAGVVGAVGNVTFLIGILQSGLADLHAVTHAPELERSLVHSAPFVMGMWRPDLLDFQYTSSPGYARGSGTAMLNGLCAAPLAYLWRVTGADAYATYLAGAYMGLLRGGGDEFGKHFAASTRDVPEILAALKAAAPTCPAAARAMSASREQLRMATFEKAMPPEALRIRGPVDKIVFLLHPGGATRIETTRVGHGARPKEEQTGTVSVLGPDGAVVASTEFDTDLPYEWALPLPAGTTAGLYTVRIHDDMRAIWDVKAAGCKRVFATEPPPHLGSPGPVRFYFRVPEGTQAFTASASGLHDGDVGIIIYDPDGVAQASAFANASGAVAGSRTVTTEVTPAPGQTGAMWSFAAMAHGDLGLKLEGVPGYIATSPDEWFDPAAVGP